jgi:uncharacterized protein (TIGR03435 family)
MLRLTTSVVVAIASSALFAQTTIRPTFDAASIKLNTTGPTGSPNAFLSGGRYVASTTARSIIRFAYDPMIIRQITGGPSWLDVDRYDIQAKGQGNPNGDMLRLMLRQLLVDRFAFRAHVEPRETEVYALMRARNDGTPGPQLTPGADDCARARDGGSLPDAPPSAPGCGFRTLARSSPSLGVQIEVTGEGVTMSQFAQYLSGLTPVGRVVVDRTGLAGGYDTLLSFSGAGVSVNGAHLESSSGASIFTAVQEQLGLKLESTKASVDFLVIDNVHRPTDD